jgi:hypothetical protein
MTMDELIDILDEMYLTAREKIRIIKQHGENW